MQNIDNLQNIIDVVPNPVIVKNRDHRIVLLNEAACTFVGHSRDALRQFSDFDLFPDEQVKVFHAADDRVFSSGGTDEVEEEVTDANGRVRTVITRKQRITLNGQHFIVGIMTDVTAYRAVEERNRFLAFHDVLTGLPNRALLNELLDRNLFDSPPRPARSALIYVDLDRFKEVNDTFGHGAGDELIRQFAFRLGKIVGPSGIAARLGGDEFAILLEDIRDSFPIATVCER